MNLRSICFFCAITFLLQGCGIFRPGTPDLPPLDKPSFVKFYADFKSEGFVITLVNELPVEQYVILRSTDEAWQAVLGKYNPVQLSANDQVTLPAFGLTPGVDTNALQSSLLASSFLGNPNTVNPDTQYLYTLPVPSGSDYRILQGYNGRFSHYRDYNRYAIDFGMPVGDTIYAVRDGSVGYLFEDSSLGGNHEAYLKYANSIMIIHDDGTVAQYSHLQKDGVLVDLGQRVRAGQPIGISGETGFVSGAHLHFNLMKPTPKGLVSIPLDFEQHPGKTLIKNKVINH
jgi:murein DD-endopeptidase MepM/ murein hydrolase activator NlpD